MCLRNQSAEICDHPECISYMNMLHASSQANTNRILESLMSLLINRQVLLTTLHDSLKVLVDKTDKLKSINHQVKLEDPVSRHPFLLNQSYDLKIVSVDLIKNQVFKEKGFCLKFQVQNSKKEVIHMKDIFKVKLYSSESPPKLLKTNISSKKIMRGTLESVMDDQGTVMFENIVINEVSSHYVNESFSLVVLCGNSEVQPFVLENLSVRARNFHKKGNSHNNLEIDV